MKAFLSQFDNQPNSMIAMACSDRHRRYNCLMPATPREQIREAIEKLPPDATFEDAIERLVFLAKIEAGLAELDADKGIPHDEVKRRLGL